MVKKNTLIMAESLICSELKSAIVPPVDNIRMLGEICTETDHTADNAEVEHNSKRSTHHLTVLTSMPPSCSHIVVKNRNIDRSASVRKSEDDDGYSSRSSLDSPVQASRSDSVVGLIDNEPGDDVSFVRAAENELVDPLPFEQKVDNLEVRDNNQLLAAVASLDHSYLMGTEPPSECDNPVTNSTESLPSRDQNGCHGNSQINVNGLPFAAEKNFSVFVVPQTAMPSKIRWRARIVPSVERDLNTEDQSNEGLMKQLAPVGTTHMYACTSNGVSHIQSAQNESSGRPMISLKSGVTTWVPISSVLAGNGLRSKSGGLNRVSLSTLPRQQENVRSGRNSFMISASGVSHHMSVSADCTSARTGSAYMRTRIPSTNDVKSCEVHRTYHSGESLHPLVDHDYGAFATFNAEVQSSIISTTTDGISQLDWRNIRRYRAARAKITHTDASSVVPIDNGTASEFAVPEMRTKRKYCRRQPLVHCQTPSPVPVKPVLKKFGGRKGRPPSIETKHLTVSRKRSLTVCQPVVDEDSKNYVKIPGCYQDDFVYYATKRTRGRPRKTVESTGVQSTAGPRKDSAVGSINVFDWYREMAQTDKSSRFGVSSSNLAETSRPNDISWSAPQLPADNCTPVDESAVADLVMDMLPKSDLDSVSNVCSTSSLVSGDFSSGNGSFAVAGERSELTVTEEDVCAMIRTLSEADIKMLASHLNADEEPKSNAGSLETDMSGDDKVNVDPTLSQYLSEYGRDNLLTLPHTSASSMPSGLLDVDDISDGDLLSADISNMNVLLRDLNTPTHDVHTSNIPVTAKTNLSSLFGSNIGGVATAPLNGSLSVDSSKPESGAPPELCVVNMFWNDLPGLMIDGLEFVRLVDIHRQVLPAKDTGILKKRCHMLGLEVRLCTDLQRDFLIRYMNAAKSKSTVVVSRADAIVLIGFYVNPKARLGRINDSNGHLDNTDSELRQVSESATQSSSVGPLMRDGGISTLSAQKKTFVTQHAVPESHRAELDSSVPNVKRSDRLRDRRVHYADMVLGVHSRSASDNEMDVKKSSRQSRARADSSSRHTQVVNRQTLLPANEHGIQRSKYVSGFDAQTSTVNRSMYRSTCLTAATDIGEIISNRKHSSPSQLQASADSKLKVTAAKVVLRESNNSAAQSVLLATELPSEIGRNVHLRRTRRTLSRRRKRRFPSLWKRRAAAALAARKGVCSITLPSVAQETLDEGAGNPMPVMDCQKSATEVETMVSATESKPAVLNVDSVVSDMVGENSSIADLPSDVIPAGNLTENIQQKFSEAAREAGAVGSAQTKVDSLLEAKLPQQNVVAVMHCDMTCHVGRKRHVQHGQAALDVYTSSEAPCVTCCTCKDTFTVSSFLLHQHGYVDPSHLVAVDRVRRLGPCGTVGEEWGEFRRRRAAFEDTCLQDADCDLFQCIADTCDRKNNDSVSNVSRSNSLVSLSECHSTLTENNTDLVVVNPLIGTASHVNTERACRRLVSKDTQLSDRRLRAPPRATAPK